MLFDNPKGDFSMQDIRFAGKVGYYIDNIDFSTLTRNKDSYCRMKDGKDKYSLIFTAAGKMSYFPERECGGGLIAEHGALCFMPRKIPYTSRYTLDGTTVKLLVFDIVSSDTLPGYLQKPAIYKNTEINGIFSSIDNSNMTNTLTLAAKIYELLYLISKDNETVPAKYAKITAAINEVKLHYFQNEKTSYYADLCGMSESNFRKLFKEYTGKSFIDYRNTLRIGEAHKLISGGECTVSEAAYFTGFNNMSFFYETYKKHFGQNSVKKRENPSK